MLHLGDQFSLMFALSACGFLLSFFNSSLEITKELIPKQGSQLWA